MATGHSRFPLNEFSARRRRWHPTLPATGAAPIANIGMIPFTSIPFQLADRAGFAAMPIRSGAKGTRTGVSSLPLHVTCR
jgi:hypothetical protein